MVLQSLSKTDWNVQTKCVPIQVSVRCDPKQIPKLVFKPNLNLLCGCLSHTGLFLSNWLQSWTSEEQPVPWIRDSINTNN